MENIQTNDVDFNEWYEEYKPDIRNMYQIVSENFKVPYTPFVNFLYSQYIKTNYRLLYLKSLNKK